jgi:hypothetical protein
MKEFFLANLVLLFKNGAALIFANFLGILVVSFSAFPFRRSSSRFVKIVCTRTDLRHCMQPTRAAHLLLEGFKIEPCTIIIMDPMQ